MNFAHFSHIWGKGGMTPYQRYEELWRELELCDQLGFDYSFCVEHHFRPDESWMSSPSFYAVGAGARTRRMRVGPMGYIVPLYHPLRLAEEIAIVDQMLGGRLEPTIFARSASITATANRRPSNSSITCARPTARRNRFPSMVRISTPTMPKSRYSRRSDRTRRCG